MKSICIDNLIRFLYTPKGELVSMAQAERDSYWNGINVIGDPGWGDAGKGKFVDLASQSVDMNIRYNGGANAGHTVVNDLGEFKLHIIPSSVFHPEVLSIIAGTVVVDPIRLADEITELQARGVDINLQIDANAHMVMPWHKALDGLKEASRAGNKLGTTGQGIGPAIAQRATRSGLRIGDLLLATTDFEARLQAELLEQQSARQQFQFDQLLAGVDTTALSDEQFRVLFCQSRLPYYEQEQILEDVRRARDILVPHIAHVLPTVWSYEQDGKNILGESAQGGLLDLDLGGYPYVTSSNPGVAGFIRATAIDRNHINKVVGVIKAYTTRVGEGPMPTEQHEAIGHYLQEVGQEVGATTGRPRRCGWLDIPAMRYGVKVLGADSVVLTKLDILDQLPQINICTQYKIDGQVFDILPNSQALQKAQPYYETVEGWQEDTSDIESYESLPRNAQRYISRVEELIGKRIDMVSVGRHRNATLSR